MERSVTEKQVAAFQEALCCEECSTGTVEAYLRDTPVRRLACGSVGHKRACGGMEGPPACAELSSGHGECKTCGAAPLFAIYGVGGMPRKKFANSEEAVLRPIEAAEPRGVQATLRDGAPIWKAETGAADGGNLRHGDSGL